MKAPLSVGVFIVAALWSGLVVDGATVREMESRIAALEARVAELERCDCLGLQRWDVSAMGWRRG